jgi:hypothetical protein
MTARRVPRSGGGGGASAAQRWYATHGPQKLDALVQSDFSITPNALG